MSAPPDTDRSLTADHGGTEPDKAAAEAEALRRSQVPQTNAAPDVSSLSRDQLVARVKTLSDNLTAASTEAEFFRRQWQDLRLRDEALGVEALTGDDSRLKDKLVAAVAEYYQSEVKRQEAIKLLDKLLTTTTQIVQTAPNYDPKVRADYEVASRAARDYLAGRSGATVPVGATLSDAKIADFNPQLNAVILNVGKTQGVKEGMTFILFQGDRPSGTARVVLARDVVSAAIADHVPPGITLKVGDRAQLTDGP